MSDPLPNEYQVLPEVSRQMAPDGDLAARLHEIDVSVQGRLHEHGKHIARIEGVLQERYDHLREADAQARQDIANAHLRVERLAEKIDGRLEKIGESVATSLAGIKSDVDKGHTELKGEMATAREQMSGVRQQLAKYAVVMVILAVIGTGLVSYLTRSLPPL